MALHLVYVTGAYSSINQSIHRPLSEATSRDKSSPLNKERNKQSINHLAWLANEELFSMLPIRNNPNRIRQSTANKPDAATRDDRASRTPGGLWSACCSF
jgi:hypothetical protein